MPQPSFVQATDNRWLNRQVIRYGGKPLPVVSTVKPWVDLNDGVSLYAQNFDITDAKALQYERQPWRAEAVWMPEDYDPAVAKITVRIDETNGMTLQQARALLLTAGEQWLTFDNATGMVAKCRTFGTPKLIVNAAPYLWEADVEFIAREPWFQDLQPSGSTPNLLNPNGGFENAGSTQTLWRSLDTLSTGTLNYWSANANFSIASNVVTVTGAGQLIVGGHPDWGDVTFTTRFQWNTGQRPSVKFHYVDGSNMIYCTVDSTALNVYKQALGVFTVVGGSAAYTALTTATWYWLRISSVGTSYTFTLYADSSGALGAQIVSVTFTIADASIQTGKVGIGTDTSSPGTTLYGGAYQGTCIVTGPMPAGVSTNINVGEPSFAWSQVSPYQGTRSLSIYSPVTGGSGYYGISSPALTVGASYIYSAAIKVVGNGWGRFGENQNAKYAQVNGPAGWTVASVVVSNGFAAPGFFVDMTTSSAPVTVYYDALVIQQAFEATAGLYAQPFQDQILLGAAPGGSVANFTIQYPGTVWAKPQWVFNIPVSSNITQIKLQNSTSGEVITINFSPALTAALTLTVDANTLRITDQNGNDYDWTGSFPMLYPGANTMVATLTTSSGSLNPTLDTKWTNRWVL